MQKLMYVVPEDFGFISHRLALAKKMMALGSMVSVVTSINNHGKIISDEGIKLIELTQSKNNLKRYAGSFKIILNLISIYRRENPDIVHHFTIRMVILGSIAAIFSKKIQVVNTITGLGSVFISHRLKYKLIRSIISTSLRLLLPGTNTTVQNHDDYKFIKKLGIPKDKIHLILGSGVDTDLYTPYKKSNQIPIIALPSRMLWVKGVGEFVKAGRILKKTVKCKLVLIGSNDNNNPDSIDNEQLIKWQDEGVIEWWGHQTDMVSILKMIDIVCFPSYREGLPKSLLEAASSGIPIVTTDSPGCREVVKNSINGFLVPSRDFKALIEPLKVLVENNKLRSVMGNAGREKIMSELSSDIIIQQNINLYKNINHE